MSLEDFDPEAKSFAYHAHALGLSASLTRPCCETIPSLATASLSITGGESYSTVRNFDWKGLISFDEASAYATGSVDNVIIDNERRARYNTLSTVTVRNLNVANMVHADLVVARVTSKHIAGDPEGEITFTGSTIQGLVVAGRHVDVGLDERPFLEAPTYDQFVRQHKQAQVDQNETPNVYCTSLAATLNREKGCKIPIPEFGTIYFAQVIMKPGYRRISMLRFELGCPIAGTVEVAGGESNGVEYWPP
ncbi:MAG TPA: hypothetical protein VGJ82_04875 [Thermoanaerobaculia bacterium]